MFSIYILGRKESMPGWFAVSWGRLSITSQFSAKLHPFQPFYPRVLINQQYPMPCYMSDMSRDHIDFVEKERLVAIADSEGPKTVLQSDTNSIFASFRASRSCGNHDFVSQRSGLFPSGFFLVKSLTIFVFFLTFDRWPRVGMTAK